MAGDEAREAAEKAMREHPGSEGGDIAGDPEGMPPADSAPDSPKGVGDSDRRSAEDIARREGGGETHGHKGPAQRPYGTTDEA
jgi:hypothetical protein